MVSDFLLSFVLAVEFGVLFPDLRSSMSSNFWLFEALPVKNIERLRNVFFGT